MVTVAELDLCGGKQSKFYFSINTSIDQTNHQYNNRCVTIFRVGEQSQDVGTEKETQWKTGVSKTTSIINTFSQVKVL